MKILKILETKDRIYKIVASLLCILLWACVFAYASLMGVGTWADEWVVFRPEYSFSQWVDRIWNWSPRPFSEALIAGYAHISNFFTAQLIAPTLIVFWFFTLTLGVIFPIFRSEKELRFLAFVFSSFVFSNFIIYKFSAEILYWPMATAPYFIMLGAVAGYTWEILFGKNKDLTIWGMLLLCIIAGLYEVGALLVVFYITTFLFISFVMGISKRSFLLKSIMPFAFSILVLWRVSVGRISSHTEDTTSHLFLESLASVFKEAPKLLGHLWYIFPIFLCAYLCASFLEKRKSSSLEENVRIFSWCIGLLLAIAVLDFLPPYYFGVGVPVAKRYFNELSGLAVVFAVVSGIFLNILSSRVAVMKRYRNLFMLSGFVGVCIFSLVIIGLGLFKDIIPTTKILSERKKIEHLNYLMGFAHGDEIYWKLIPDSKYTRDIPVLVNVIGVGEYSKDSTGNMDWPRHYYNKQVLKVTAN